MVCDVVEIAAGVGVAWARRDGVGVSVAAAVPGVAAVPSSTVSAIALALVLSEPRSLFVASACACCLAVS